jgi:hypothetical protein
MLKALSESFDKLQDERTPLDIIEDFPFMLRLSKHSEPFFISKRTGSVKRSSPRFCLFAMIFRKKDLRISLITHDLGLT